MSEKNLDTSTNLVGLTEQEWEQQKDYADNVQIEVRFRSWAGADDEDEIWFIKGGPAAWSVDWLTLELVNIGTTLGPGTYHLDTHTGRSEWGASGAVIEYVLTLSQDVMNEAALLALGALAVKLKEKSKRAFGTQLDEHPSEAEASETAIWELVMRKGLEKNSLEVRSYAAPKTGVCSVEVLDRASGVTYGVEITSTGGIRSGRIWRVSQ